MKNRSIYKAIASMLTTAMLFTSVNVTAFAENVLENDIVAQEDNAETITYTEEVSGIADEIHIEENSEELSEDSSSMKEATTENGVRGIKNIANPRIVPDSSMNAGQKVTYDCIWLGSYPQAEVVADKSSYTAIGADYLEEGDIIENAALYSQLQSASYSSNNETTINGTRYKRMKMSDATYANSGYSYYYNWSDSTTYHYFKYEPIKWRVIEKGTSTAFLLADKGLDDQKYNKTYTSDTWKDCDIRNFLNTTFYDNAFNTSEKAMIRQDKVENADNLYYGTDGGEDTYDNVFLLSEKEIYKTNGSKSFSDSSAAVHGFADSYYTDDEARRARATTYSRAMGSSWSTDSSYKGNSWWWLRSPGSSSSYAAPVDLYGSIYSFGFLVFNDHFAARPALKINLSSLTDSMYAGTVCTDGMVNETAKPGEGGGSSSDGDLHYYNVISSDPKNITYENGKYSAENIQFNISVLNMDLPDSEGNYQVYNNMRIEFVLSDGLTFEDSGTNIKKINLGTLSGATRKLNYDYKVNIDTKRIFDSFEMTVKMSADGYENIANSTYSVPVSIVVKKPNNSIIDVVDKYCTGDEIPLAVEICNGKYSQEEKSQRMFELFNCDNWFDVQEQIKYIQDSHDQRWAYNGLIWDDMYTSYQYYNYLNNTPKGKVAKASLVASGLAFNGELGTWLNPSTYVDGSYPGVEKNKKMLEEYMDEQRVSLEYYSNLKATQKFVKSTVGIMSDVEKGEALKELGKTTNSVQVKSWLNNFYETRLKGAIDGKEIVQKYEEDTLFAESMGVTNKVFKINFVTLDVIQDFVNVESNLEMYNANKKFLMEIAEAEDLPWELRTAAKLLIVEYEEAYGAPIVNVLKEIRDTCFDKALDGTKFSEVLSLNGNLAALDYSAFLINQFVDMGALVENSCQTESYYLLAKHYSEKLKKCRTKFNNNKNETNAWEFYDTYVTLWRLRKAGEEKFLKMNKLEGGKIVDGLSEVAAGGTIAGLISEVCGYSEKEKCINEMLATLNTFAFDFDLDSVEIPEEYKYLQKTVVACPVNVEYVSADGKVIATLQDEKKVDFTNEYGRFKCMYRPATGDYVKIAMLYRDDNISIRSTGTKQGTVTYNIARTANHKDIENKTIKNVSVNKDSIVNVSLSDNTYSSDEDGDGKSEISGSLADGSKIFAQLDYAEGNKIEIVYASSDGTVSLPKEPQLDGYKFLGWYNKNDEVFESGIKIKESISLHAKWGWDKVPDQISNPHINKNGDMSWAYIEFGNYWQEDTNSDGVVDEKDDKTPIGWRVLSTDGNKALLLSDVNLDRQPYNVTRETVTWEESTIRSWLNGYDESFNKNGIDYSRNNFIDAAFDEEEKQTIKDTLVVNDNVPNIVGIGYREGGNDTNDKIFFISWDDTLNSKYGFSESFDERDLARVGKSSLYKIPNATSDMNCWWTRTPAPNTTLSITTVERDGSYAWTSDSLALVGVRPALYIDLNSKEYKYVGTIDIYRNIEQRVEVTPSPTPGGEEGGEVTPSPTPTPGGEEGGEETPTPTPGGEEGDEVTPTPTPSAEPIVESISLSGKTGNVSGEVTFDLVGANPIKTLYTIANNGKKAVLTKNLTRTGYTFKGWFYKDSKTGKEKKITAIDEKILKSNPNLKVTAKWQENAYTVQFKIVKPDKKAKVVKTKGMKVGNQKVLYESKAVTLYDSKYLSCDGYELVGWTKDLAAKANPVGSYEIESDTTKLAGDTTKNNKIVLYSVWKKK